MKTFKNIQVGEDIYFIKKNADLLDVKDRYGNTYAADLLNVTKIETLVATEKGIRINPYKRDLDEERHDLVLIPKNSIDLTEYETERFIFFCNKKHYDQVVRNLILDEIKQEGEKIRKVEQNALERVKRLREAYFDYLNDTGIKLTNPDKSNEQEN